MQDTGTMAGERMISEIMERIRGTARVEAVYGEPRTVGDKTIIPIANLSYGFGAGAGSGPSHEGHVDGGGGGGVRVHPVGVIEMTPEGSRMIPIIDWTSIIGRTVTFIGLVLLIGAVRRRRR